MNKTLKNIDLNLISESILSIIVLLMGVIVMIFKTFGLIEIVLYGSILFYIYALFSTILYFVGRKEGDYELLLLSLINIITATFMFLFKNDNEAMILGAGMTIFTILLVANRGVKIIQLRREDNYIWIVKFVVTFLIGFLGMLTTFNLFNNVTVQTMMFGFYFISLGFMLTIESLINMFISNDTFKKILSKVIEDESTKKIENIKESEPINIEENILIDKKERKVKAINKKDNVQKQKSNKVKEEKEVTPKKTETKKPGRPKKEKVKKEEIKKETIVETTPKKRPGRPKKNI